jgi:uncharacterized membrane protein YczE
MVVRRGRAEGRARQPIVRTVSWPTRAQLRGRGPRLAAGLAIIGIGIALMVQARLGLAPYEVLNQGVAVRTPLSIGQASIVLGLGVLVLWIPLRQRPGLGTLTNIVAVGLMLDAWLVVVPEPTSMVARLAFCLGGLTLIGTGIGMYIGAGLGPGPRDGVMTGLADRGWPVWLVRLVLELSALLLGWYLGGNVGFGTVAFAIGVPFLADHSLRWFSVPDEPLARAFPPSSRG